MITPDVYEYLDDSHPLTGSKPWPVYSYDGTLKFSMERTNGVDRTISPQWWKLLRALLDDIGDKCESRSDSYVSTLTHYSDHVRVKYVTNRPRYKEHPIGEWDQDSAD